MFGKSHVLVVPLVFALACDSAPKEAVDKDAVAPADVAKDGAPEKAADKTPEKASDKASDKTSEKVKKWSMTYSGALSGEIGGNFIVVTRAGLGAVIKARGEDVRLSISLNKQPGTDPPVYSVLPMSAQLADGTKCTMSDMPTVNVKADEKDAIDIEVNGELECGEGEKVSYKASVEKRG